MEAISSPLLDGISINGARNVLVNITAGESLGIREATQATAVIQREAGDDAEVIFGTVIDSGMGDEIRITVIATGFETERRQAAPPVRRTVRLDEDASVPQYKGEDNLRRLDQPAYERRTPALPPEPRTEPRMEPRAERSVDFEAEERARQAKLRRVHPEDFKHRRERIRKDDADVPAFLRKMMD
jgi:cell division protein FtsZ